MSSPRKRYDWEQVLRRIEAGTPVAQKGRRPEGLPSQFSILARSKSHPDWGARYRAAMAGRNAPAYDWDKVAGHIIGGERLQQPPATRPAYMPDYHAIWKHARRHPEWARQVAAGQAARRITPEIVVTQAMLALPVGLPDHVRNDVAQDIYLAVLEGRAGGDIKACAKLCLSRHRRLMGSFKELSLDAPMPGFDGRMSYIDALPSDAVHL